MKLIFLRKSRINLNNQKINQKISLFLFKELKLSPILLNKVFKFEFIFIKSYSVNSLNFSNQETLNDTNKFSQVVEHLYK